jgi:hypothetical protein
MVSDYKLDACGDLLIVDGDLVLIEGKAQAMQACLVFLKTNLTEFFYDTDLGIPWIQKVFVKGTTVAEIRGYIQRGLTALAGVDQVVEIIFSDYESHERRIEIQIKIKFTEDGTIDTLIYRGTASSTSACYINALQPRLYDDLAVWIDTSTGSLDNLAKDFVIGTSTINGMVELPKIDIPNALSLTTKALKLSNLYSSTNYASFKLDDTPYNKAGNSLTIFLVAAPTQKVNYEDPYIGLFSHYGLDTADNLALVDSLFIENTTPVHLVYNQKTVSGSGDEDLVFNSNLDYNTKRVIAVKVNKTTGSITVIENNAVLGAQGSVPALNNRIYDGSIAVGGSFDLSKVLETFLNGAIGEFIVYHTLLSDVDTYALYRYLSLKWGV